MRFYLFPQSPTQTSQSTCPLSSRRKDSFTYRWPINHVSGYSFHGKPPTNISNANVTGSYKDGDQAASTSQPSSTAKRKLPNIQSSQTTEPDSKRAKPTPLQFKKHPEFWHLDGNTLIQIDGTRFKLHRSWLSNYSTFFADFFNGTGCMARNKELVSVEESDDGEVVFRISGTTVEDFETLLSAIYNSMYVFMTL